MRLLVDDHCHNKLSLVDQSQVNISQRRSNFSSCYSDTSLCGRTNYKESKYKNSQSLTPFGN